MTTETSTERVRRWRAANPERTSALARAWYAANREKANASYQRWYAANREKDKARVKAHATRLSTVYVVAKLQQANPTLKRADIPPEIIEAKRRMLRLKRELRG